MKLVCVKIIRFIFPLFIFFSFSLFNNRVAFSEETTSPYRTTPSSTPVTSPKCNEFTFDASNSYDPDKENISFYWDLGDGTTSREPVVTHKYEQSGDYKVVLTVTDTSGLQCSTAVTSQVVRSSKRPNSAFTAPDKACSEQPLTFEVSASEGQPGKKINYYWDFGYGTKVTGQTKVTKSYNAGGDFKVSLKVDDGGNTFCSSDTTEKLIHINQPPMAIIGEDTILKCVANNSDLEVTFDASKSNDANNDDLSYYWDFGDGTKGEGVHVTHKYVQLGNYDVKLIAKDSSTTGCSTGIAFATIRLNEAPRAEAGPDAQTCPGEEVDFDGTNSYVNKKGTATFQWTFGDGQSAQGAKVSHSYTKSGKYQASLTIEDKLNPTCQTSTDIRTVSVNAHPVVNLKADTAVCLGSDVNFDASASNDADGDNLVFYWSFGDGSVLRAGPKVTHNYKQSGKYRVTVIADDGKKTSCSTVTATAMVKVNSPPTADAGPNLSCCIDTSTDFNASASADPDGDNLTTTWDFGDGTKAKGAIVGHTYTKGGSYNVVMTVDDGSGTSCSKATAGFVAQVNSGPVPVMNVR